MFTGTDGGIFKSRDSGRNWAAVNAGVTDSDIVSLAIDPTNPRTVYAGTDGGGVFRSTNGGITWIAVNAGLADTDDDCEPFVTPNALAIAPTTPSTLYAATNHGVFRSPDSGTSWAAIDAGLPYLVINALVLDPNAPSTLYAGVRAGGVYESTDSGNTWTAVNAGLSDPFVNVLAISPTAPRTLYAGTDGGIGFDTRAQTGAACTTSGDCPSGNCVDGICCDGACSATCQSCANRRTGGPNGICAAVLVGLQTSNGCGTAGGACDGGTGLGSCAVPTPTPIPCVGDCDRSGIVNMSDLITGVNIALGSLPVSACPAVENAQGTVDIAQLIQGVSNALNGCGVG